MVRAPKPMTPYTETEALLAVMNDDTERLEALLDDMLPGEISALHEQVLTLDAALRQRLTHTPLTDYQARHRRR